MWLICWVWWDCEGSWKWDWDIYSVLGSRASPEVVWFWQQCDVSKILQLIIFISTPKNFNKIFYLFIFMCISIWLHVWMCPGRSEGIGLPRLEIADCWELPCEFWGPNQEFLPRQQLLLTAGPFLRPLWNSFRGLGNWKCAHCSSLQT